MSRRETQAERDARFMRRALELARKGTGRTSPNPAVGAVVVRRGRIVGEGFTQPAGGAHAEVGAIAAAGEKARGATLYCTLEPCCRTGRTGPCTEAIVSAGIVRLVGGATDPNPGVKGRGFRALRAAGVEVVSHVEEAACRQQIRFFRKHIATGLPFVRLKLATSLDGKIASRTGASHWITGAPARRRVHAWRNEMDAVMVGVGTVLADDPRLNTRIRGGRDPIRVVVDSKLRTPTQAALLKTGKGRVIFATTRSASGRREKALVARGAEVLRVASQGGRVDPGSLLRHLGKLGILSVLVEGGAALAASLMRADCVDELALFQAPVFIGGDGKSMCESLGIRTPADGIRLGDHEIEWVGRDMLHMGRPVGPGRK
jgi:diaminohydroxyphosphoribosylaminopyrimidine deaminase/5-amino-6-(5-phosphoribosylamino)uracil reductase